MSVYFIQNEAGHIKIGYTDSPSRRLSSLQTGSPGRLQYMRIIDGGAATERWLHRRFESNRLHGEWFDFVPEMLTVLPPDEVPVRRVVRPILKLTLKETLLQNDSLNLYREGADDRLSAASLFSAFSDEDTRAFIQWVRERTGIAEMQAAA